MNTTAIVAHWMGVEEAARYAEVTPQRITDAVTSGELRAVTTNPMRSQTWMIRASEVERWASRGAMNVDLG